MVIKSEKKRTFGIIGLPRSGTTLLANIFNSIDNSICLSEPIREMHSNKLKVPNTDNLLEGTNKFIQNSKENDIFGIKETYSHVPSRTNREIRKLFKRDFLIFIIREPKSCFSGWKQLKMIPKSNNSDIIKSSNYIYKPRYKFGSGHYIKCYKSLIEDFHDVKMNKPTFLIRYEDLCKNFSSEYMNDIFKGYIEFEGELEQVNNAIISLGDHLAIDTKEIKKPRLSYDNISDNDIKNIDRELKDIYERTRGYGYY